MGLALAGYRGRELYGHGARQLVEGPIDDASRGLENAFLAQGAGDVAVCEPRVDGGDAGIEFGALRGHVEAFADGRGRQGRRERELGAGFAAYGGRGAGGESGVGVWVTGSGLVVPMVRVRIRAICGFDQAGVVFEAKSRGAGPFGTHLRATGEIGTIWIPKTEKIRGNP